MIRYMMDAWDAITGEKEDYENWARYLISKAFRLLRNPDLSKGQAQSGNITMIKRMKHLLSYIEEHYTENINNQILMEEGFCSESVLLRSSKQTVGLSPMQYVMDYRITKAASLLRSTDRKSCDIAMACGFNDFSYFTKVFRRHMGKTPGEYRKRL